MYIEINERQSGKTTRLVEHAFNFLMDNPNKRICIIGAKMDLSKLIKNRIINKFITIENIENQEIRKIEKKIHRCTNMHTIGVEYDFYYVDEFLFLKKDDLLIRDNAYYCTSLYSDIVSMNPLKIEYYLPENYEEDNNSNTIIKALLNYKTLKRKWKIKKILNDKYISFAEFLIQEYKINNKKRI